MTPIHSTPPVFGAFGVARMLDRARTAWRPHRRLALALLGILFVQQLFTTGLALSLKLIVDDLLSPGGLPLFALLMALAAGYLLAAVGNLTGEYVASIATARVSNDIRRQLFDHLQHLALSYFSRAPLGDVLARFSADLEVLRQALVRRMVSGSLAVIGLAINLPVLFYLEWRLATLTLILVPSVAVVVRRLTPRAARATYALQRAEAQALNSVQENVRAQPVLRAFGLSDGARARFEEELGALERTSIRAGFLISVVGSVSTLGVHLIQLLITGVGAYLADAGTLSPGALVAFLSLLQVVSRDSIELTKRVVPALVAASGGARRVDELLAEPTIPRDAPNATEAPTIHDALELRGVTFCYDGQQPTLHALTLRIPAGSFVALVGPSGAGKSTVLNLIMRFYEPQSGTIALDGLDIRKATRDSIRRQMAAVFQDTFLFNDTLRENIRLARPDATDAEIEAAARAAEIHEHLMSLPQGYDTTAGEAGARLSGGQRQRIAIARTLLCDPPVLLLDEATSALDPATEASINQTLRRIAPGRTVISVTHRLSAVTHADLIFVLQGGELAEAGNHSALLAHGGLYADLWRKQSGFDVSGDGRSASIDLERLRHIPIFAPLPLSALTALAAQFSSERFAPNQYVFERGDPGERFYVIVRGKVEVIAPEGEAANQNVIARLSDGDFFGELALLDDAPRNATLRATTHTLAISLDRAQFHALIAGSRDVLREIEASARARRTTT